jgi:hypothetical protein
MATPDPASERLIYHRQSLADLGRFHPLVTDGPIRRYLLDDETMARA